MNIIVSDMSASAGGTKIIDNINATIEAGKITAIVGPNGSGKTTFMSCLVGLHKITGSVIMDNQNIHTMPIKERAQKIGYLPQKNEVNWNISVRHLVDLGRMPYMGDSGLDITDQAMAMANIEHLSNRKTSSLSGGELSRVLFARVLAGNPDWIMLDEPMANLDLAHQLDMVELLKSIVPQNKNVVIILHDLNQAAQLADNLIIMSGGHIDSMGSVKQILNTAMLERVFGISANIDDSNDRLQIQNIHRIKTIIP